MPFACIFVPDFPAAAILRAEPELRAQAVVVLEGKPPLQKVFDRNEKARRAGIELGMTKIQVEACTDLVLRPRSLPQEEAAHAVLLDCAQSFSPVVEDTARDIILLDLAGLESLLGPLPRIARELARRASDLGIEVNVAVAANPDAAIIAARGFSGVTVIATGEEAECLGPLPLEVLFGGLPDSPDKQEAEQVLETLRRWGLRNLHALAALPEIPLAERLGQKGVYLQQLARGAVSRILAPIDPPLTFEETVELEYPLVLLEPLACLLEHMLEQLCAHLASRALTAQELRLKLELESGFLADEATEQNCHPEGAGFDPEQSEEERHTKDLSKLAEMTQPPSAERSRWGSRHAPAKGGSAMSTTRTSLFTRTLHFPVPMLDSKIFLKLLQLDLKAHPPGAPIRKVHLSAEPAQPRQTQSGLFLPTSPEPEKLELTLARISGIVGENKAGSVELLDTHRPDAFLMQHFAPRDPEDKKENKKAEAKKSNGNLEKTSPVTALRMFRPPLRATVTLRDGKPARVYCPKRREVQGEILWLAGPWRSSGDWWQQEGWIRDEWDIALQCETGVTLYRLVRDLLSGRWFVEGTYD